MPPQNPFYPEGYPQGYGPTNTPTILKKVPTGPGPMGTLAMAAFNPAVQSAASPIIESLMPYVQQAGGFLGHVGSSMGKEMDLQENMQSQAGPFGGAPEMTPFQNWMGHEKENFSPGWDYGGNENPFPFPYPYPPPAQPGSQGVRDIATRSMQGMGRQLPPPGRP